jgi:hypothetical protein
MRDRVDRILRIACVALAVLLLFQLVRTLVLSNPLARVTIPAVPTLSTNALAEAKGTNAPAAQSTANKNTNSLAGSSNAKSTNVVSDSGSPGTLTNNGLGAAAEKPGSNVVVVADSSARTNSTPQNQAAMVETNQKPILETTMPATNSVVGEGLTQIGSNSFAHADATNAATNSVTRSAPRPSADPRSRPELSMMGMPGMAKKLPDLPPAMKARVDRIADSEILGPVMRPMPMALLGIAGNSAFLRGPNGQTGLVKEGDSLGEIKLIRIGINRVLVEQGGQKKELMIFDGYGGESLMAKQGEIRNETIPK